MYLQNGVMHRQRATAESIPLKGNFGGARWTNQGGLTLGFVVSSGDEYNGDRNSGTRELSLQFYP